MKTLFLFIGLSVISSFAFSQNNLVIGKLDNGKPIITANIEKMCTSLATNLAKVSEVKETFTKVEIVKIDKHYFLVFHGAKYKTTFGLVLENNSFVSKMNVSCSSNGDCANTTGCTPSQNVGECLCTRCAGEGNCVKTCTTATLVEVEN